MFHFQLSIEYQELKQKLDNQTKLSKSLADQRDAALAICQQNGISCNGNMATHITDMKALRTQNEEFRNIIKQMRTELENLTSLPPQKGDEPTVNYVRYMEEEVRKVKAENRELMEQLQQRVPQGKPPTPNTARKSSSVEGRKSADHNSSLSHAQNTQHQQQLIALSETIASLHREKASLESRVQEWKGKVEDLQSRMQEEKELVNN